MGIYIYIQQMPPRKAVGFPPLREPQVVVKKGFVLTTSIGQNPGPVRSGPGQSRLPSQCGP